MVILNLNLINYMSISTPVPPMGNSLLLALVGGHPSGKQMMNAQLEHVIIFVTLHTNYTASRLIVLNYASQKVASSCRIAIDRRHVAASRDCFGCLPLMRWLHAVDFDS